MEVRFAVGVSGKTTSSSWKLWNRKRDVYLVQRSLSVQKFSFHKSRICRWASVAPRADGSDRAMVKWKRDIIPPPGTGRACLLLSLVFPSNHLSVTHVTDSKVGLWIPPAPSGMATGVEIFLTQDTETEIHHLKLRNRELVWFESIGREFNVAITCHEFDCGPVELVVPAEPRVPGQVFGELRFPNVEKLQSGRPIRMIMASQKELPPQLWELGGYQVSSLRANE